MFGAPVLWPPVRACTQETAFGGEDQVFRIGVEGFCDERLTHFWSVGVSRIYQIHSQCKGAVQDSYGFLLILWRSPDARACKAHSSEAETIYRQVPSNGECPAGCSGSLGCVLHTPISSLVLLKWWTSRPIPP